MGMFSSPFLSVLPTLDVHGYTRDSIYYPVSVFIDDNIKLRNKKIAIIHGRGLGILKDEIKRRFIKDNRVLKIYLSSENVGVTIIELK